MYTTRAPLRSSVVVGPGGYRTYLNFRPYGPSNSAILGNQIPSSAIIYGISVSNASPTQIQVGNATDSGIFLIATQEQILGTPPRYTNKLFLATTATRTNIPRTLYIGRPLDDAIGSEVTGIIDVDSIDWGFRPVTHKDYMWIKKKGDRNAYCFRVSDVNSIDRRAHLDFILPENVISWCTNNFDDTKPDAGAVLKPNFMFLIYRSGEIRALSFRNNMPDREADSIDDLSVIMDNDDTGSVIEEGDVKAIVLPLPIPYDPELEDENLEEALVTSVPDNCTISEQNGRLRAYIYISYDYSHVNARNYFDDKPLMILPFSTANIGNPYRFLLASASGRKQAPDKLINEDFKTHQDTFYMGYQTPEVQTDNANHFLRCAKEFLVQDSLNRSLSSLAGDLRDLFVVPDGELLKTLTSGNRLEGVPQVEDKHFPLLFSARALFFPLTGKQIINLNKRAFYVDKSMISYSDSVSSNNYYLTALLKNYFKTIANATSSAVELAKIGFFGESIEPAVTDPQSLTFSDQNGLSDEVLQVVFLNDRILIHTRDGLHQVSGDLLGAFSVKKFARVSLTTNLIADSSTIVGSNDKVMYAITYFDEYGGFTAYPINKKLQDLSQITELVDFLRTKRLIFGIRKGL